MSMIRRPPAARTVLAALALALLMARPAAATDHLTVLLDWFVNPNHGPLVVAQEIGAFRREGLDVSFVQPADPTIPPRLVAAGHGDIAVDYQPDLYVQAAAGLPLVRIGVLLDRPMLTYTTIKGDGVLRVADLKGKRFGYNDVGGPAGMAELGVFLATGGLTLKDVQLVNVGTALSTSLLTHRVDMVGLERNFEIFELIDRGVQPIGFDCEKFGDPPYDDLIFVVSQRTRNDPRYPRFIKAVSEGAAYIKAHPDDAWRLFIRAYPNLNNKLNRDAWTFTVPYFAANSAEFDPVKYSRFGQFLLSKGVIRSLPPISSYVLQMK